MDDSRRRKTSQTGLWIRRLGVQVPPSALNRTFAGDLSPKRSLAPAVLRHAYGAANPPSIVGVPAPGSRADGSAMAATIVVPVESRISTMVRPESWTSPAGGSPVRVIAGEPGSRPRFVVERRRAERGVESLFGGSKRAGRSATRRESCSLVTFTTEEPSRSYHGEGHVRPIAHSGHGRGRVLPGYGERHVRMGWFGTGEARLPSLVSKDRSYKPMAKSSGGKRESDGVIVPLIAVSNAAGGKDPDFGHAGGGAKCKDMTGTARSNYPDGHEPADHARQLPNRLWATAKQPVQPRVAVHDPRGNDFPLLAVARESREAA